MRTSALSKNEILDEKANRLYKDVQQAERELNNFMEYSITLNDLETVRELQIEIEYRIKLFGQYIDSIEE